MALTEAEMTSTKTSVGKRQTLAERFETYLETATGPSDAGILVRALNSRFERQQIAHYDQELFGHRARVLFISGRARHANRYSTAHE
jgi:hypothetical protein